MEKTLNFFDRCHLELCPVSFDSSLIPRLPCVGRESGNETVICDRSQMLNVTEKLRRRLCKVSDKNHVS